MICSIDDPTPTVAGMLTLGQSPRNWISCADIQFLRVQSTAFADPVVDALEIEGTNAPVRVYWFDDRIQIFSPGGTYGTVNAGNFGQPGASDYRNLMIAGVLKTPGFVQRFGFGIAQARVSARPRSSTTWPGCCARWASVSWPSILTARPT